jgi:BirA family biotin operon repressor/biotin-[acetyl-CoA-carboxylase] ligase
MEDRLRLLADRAVARAFASALPTQRVGRAIEYHSVIDSTMDRASELARSGAVDGLAVVADHQTAGRGRRGRTWGLGPPGSLLLVSWVLRVEARLASLISMLSGVALLRAAQALGARDLSVKWPNDLLLGGRKVAGVLATGTADGTGEHALILGTGIDVHTSEYAPELRDTLTSFASAGQRVDRLALLARVAAELETLVDADEEVRAGLLAQWRSSAAMLGRAVAVEEGTRRLVGEAVDVDAEGALLLRVDGHIERILAGDVSLRPA